MLFIEWAAAHALQRNGAMALSIESAHTPGVVPTRVTELFRIGVTLDSQSHFFAEGLGEIANGGLFIATDRGVPVGQPVLAQIIIEGQVIAARGTVRWRTQGGGDVPPGIGVALHDLCRQDRILIERFCARRPPFYFDVADRAFLA